MQDAVDTSVQNKQPGLTRGRIEDMKQIKPIRLSNGSGPLERGHFALAAAEK
jgi:hypothetical protein